MSGSTARSSKRRAFWFILSLVMALGLTARPAPLRAEAQASLAEELFQEGDYFRAITEFRRTIYESKDEAEILRLWMRITVAYMKAGRFSDALQTIFKTTPLVRSKPDQARLCLLTSQLYTASGVFPQARKQMEACKADGEMLSLLGADRLHLAIAATYLEAGDWDQSANQLKAAQSELARGPFVKEATLMRESVDGAARIPRRSPALAGVLSTVIPGLGQVYEGRTWDGVQAFVMVGGFAAITTALLLSDSYRKGNGLMLPIVTGTIGGFFYLSNIYGAINGARMSNLMSTSRYINEEKRKYESVWNVP